MNIVEKEAFQFAKDFYGGIKRNNLENLKSKLSSKLYNFNRDRDKLDFLKILRVESILEKVEHLKKCVKNNCPFPEERDYGVFAIDQEIEEIKRHYYYEPTSLDSFTNEDESNLHSKLNDILDQLNKQGLGQEIIFEEIESLKSHFNLGKKTWFQLLKIKLLDLTFEKALDETIVKDIYNNLSEGFSEAVKLIDK